MIGKFPDFYYFLKIYFTFVELNFSTNVFSLILNHSRKFMNFKINSERNRNTIIGNDTISKHHTYLF